MTLRSEMVETHPEFPWLDPNDAPSIESFLRERGWLAENENVTACDKAGEGNMNLTLRVETAARSFILKQARPWVEKYDHIPAPWDRILYEQGFYERVRSIPDVAGAMPALVASYSSARVLQLEDLGASNDFTQMYGRNSMADTDRSALAGYLAALHAATQDDADPEFENHEMRLLNHEHMFVVPLAESNGVDIESLEPGLNEAAAELRSDHVYVSRVQETGDRYLSNGRCLLHGDFFPGSWLKTPKGVRVIDPEFCFYGDPEFDLGVCLAHLRLSNLPVNDANAFLDAYRTRAAGIELGETWIARYAGVEIMRRLLGVAQLPIAPSLDRRKEALKASHRAVCTDTIEAMWS